MKRLCKAEKPVVVGGQLPGKAWVSNAMGGRAR